MDAHALAQEVTTENFLSLPDVVFRLNQMLDSPATSNAAIGEVLMSDPALSARVLKLANCAVYGGGKVDTVSKAIAVLGFDRIRSLVLTTFVSQAFAGIPADWVDMERFWLNNVASAVIARSLAFRCRIFDTERLFLAGLLLKLGRLVFYCCCPDQYQAVLKVIDQGEPAVTNEERKVFGFGYATLSAELMKRWQLPDTLYGVIEGYEVLSPEERYSRDVAIVRLASELAAAIEPGRQIAEDADFPGLELDDRALTLLGIPAEHIPNLMLDVWAQTFEIMGIIRPNFATVR